MKQCRLLLLLLAFLATGKAFSQTLSIDNVYTIQVESSGTIMEAGQVKGYYIFYQSDKIDKHTNEFTVQLLDQNLNKVKSIKFTDDKSVKLMEASFNGSAFCFLFYNEDEKTLIPRVYDLSGKLKAEYSRVLDKKSVNYMKSQLQWGDTRSEDGKNQKIFDVKDKGFVTLIPIRDGKDYSYEVTYYSSITRKEWSYTPQGEERVKMASFLGCTDSVVFLESMVREKLMSAKSKSSILALNFETKKVAFDLDEDASKFKLVPIYCAKQDNGSILLMGSYYNKEDNVLKDYSQGLGIYTINSEGKILSSTYNSWTGDMSKYLEINEKGKLEDIGYLYFHNLIKTKDGKIFAVAEGYKRVADGLGIAMNVLAASQGGLANGSNTKVKITDMVLLEFDANYKVKNATVYKKESSSMSLRGLDYYSQHMFALMVKALNGFDYSFTTYDNTGENFTVCYLDYEKTSDYKGAILHALRYDGAKFREDKVQLKTKASSQRVFPAKPGYVSILEYFKKEKKLDFRLEKLN
jgi:hypothetical protein